MLMTEVIMAGEDPRWAELAEVVSRANGSREQPTFGFPFLSPGELLADGGDEVEWVWHGYLAAGGLTLVSGKPKAGKSTLVFSLVAAMVGGRHSFAGRPLAAGPVVYLSEEGRQTLLEKVRAHGITPAAPLRIRPRLHPKPTWADAVRLAAKEAVSYGARLLVVDTFRFWAALAADAEKDAGAVSGAMTALLEAAEAGLAVILVHHERKGGGDEGEGVSGSNAIVAAADVSLEVHRIKDGAPTQRLLVALSRYESTPEAVIIDRVRHEYRQDAEGTRERVTTDVKRQRILTVLGDADPEFLTSDQVSDATGMGRENANRDLRKMVDEGSIQRVGKGRKGDPYRYGVSVLKDAHTDGAQKTHGYTPTPDSPFCVSGPVGSNRKENLSGVAQESFDLDDPHTEMVAEPVEDWRELLPEEEVGW